MPAPLNGIQTRDELLAKIPAFEQAFDYTGTDPTELLTQRFNAEAYALPPHYLTLRLSRDDQVFSYQENAFGLLDHGRAGQDNHGLIVAGYRLELPTVPYRQKGEILFSTLDTAGDVTREPRVYIGIGLAAMANRVMVWGPKKDRASLRIVDPAHLLDRRHKLQPRD